MQPAHKDEDSLLKLALLKCAFDRNGSINVIEKILKNKGDINYRVPECALTKSERSLAGCTALHFSQEYYMPNKGFSKLLLEYGADITIKNNEGETALHKAIKEFDLRNKSVDGKANDILWAHVSKSITENPGDRHGLTHFHIACMSNHFNAVEFFLDNNVSVDLAVGKDSSKFPECTPLHIAVRSCALKVVKVLIEHNANQHLKDNEGMTALHWIIERNKKIVDFVVLEENELPVDKFPELKVNEQIVELLSNSNKIESSIYIDEVGLSDFHIACTLENVSMVEKLLPKVTQINHRVSSTSQTWPGYTALHFAAHFNLDVVKILVGKGANIMIENRNGFTPFEICLERYPIQEIHILMSMQPEWKSITLLDGKTKLLDIVSAMQDISEFKSFLDEHITDVNTSVSHNSSLWPGYTLLHLAVLLSEQTKNEWNYSFVKNQHNSIEAQFNPHLELVEECLKRGANVIAQDLFGCTPLHLAFRYQKTDTIKKLLEFHHSAINPIDKYNVSHLHIACAAADENIAKKLLQSDATNLNLAVLYDFKFVVRSGSTYSVKHIPTGSTPLHVAVAVENYEVVKILVDSGADVNVVDINGVTPVHRLLDPTWANFSKISEVLLSANLMEVVVSDSGLSHLHVASYFGNADAVKRLLDLGANVDARLGCMSTLINFYRRYGSRGSCRLLYEQTTALHMSMSPVTRSEEVINLLIKHGADILAKDADGMSVLHKMIYEKSNLISSVELLDQHEGLKRRIEEDSDLTAIHLATVQLNVAVIKKLIESGVDVNARIKDDVPYLAGWTPLHLLAYKFYEIYGPKRDDMFETVKILLEAGADVTLTDAEGNTPIHVIFKYTSGKCKTQFIGLMLNAVKNYRVNPVGEYGLSLFHIACLQNNVPIMKTFLEHGVDINAPISLFNESDFDEYTVPGNSVLHLVIMTSSYNDQSLSPIETLEFLLEHDADVNARNAFGDTPLHFAIHVAADRIDIFEQLIKAGADLEALNVEYDTPFATLLATLTYPPKPKEIQYFIDHGCHVNVFNSITGQGHLSRPLYIDEVAFEDQSENFEALFKSPDIIMPDAEGRTAIHNIVSIDGLELSSIPADTYTKVISRLCSMGCDIDSPDLSGETALHYATRYFINNTAIIALLRNGADINILDESGRTSISYGVEYFERESSEDEEWFISMMEIFYTHLSKLQNLNLSLNDVNRYIFSKFSLLNFHYRASCKEGLISFFREIGAFKKYLAIEGSASFMFSDLLSETGVIAKYSFVTSVQLLNKKFFTMIETYFVNHTAAIGIYKLQMRKAVKRFSLINSARDSLKVCIPTKPFPLPEICCDIVLRFLSNMDLENLINSTNDD